MKIQKSFFRILTVCLLAAVLAFAAVACKPERSGSCGPEIQSRGASSGDEYFHSRRRI